MERLSIFTALAITVALSLTLGAAAHKPAPNGNITYVSGPDSEARTRF